MLANVFVNFKADSTHTPSLSIRMTINPIMFLSYEEARRLHKPYARQNKIMHIFCHDDSHYNLPVGAY